MVVTRTSTVAADSAGEVAVMEVALLTVKPVAAVAPKDTALAPVKLVPVMVTVVPPAVAARTGAHPGDGGAGGTLEGELGQRAGSPPRSAVAGRRARPPSRPTLPARWR